MTDYTKTTDFAAKDSLPSGDSGKIIRGTEFETEFDNISTSIATKANLASPTFTGTATIPTAAVTTFTLGGTTVTATATELNLLDGVTATTTELNYLDVTTLGEVEASKAVTADSSGDVLFGDNKKALFGTGSDLKIYHDGSNSYIEDEGTGSLFIRSEADLRLQSFYGTEDFLKAQKNGAVTLYWANLPRLATSNAGVDVTGKLSATSLAINSVDVTATAAELNILDGVTADATELNLLDGVTSLPAYASGTWTPEVADAVTGGNVATNGGSLGRYVKIGDFVQVNMIITNIDTTGLTGSNQIFVRDLPFTARDTTPTSFYLGVAQLYRTGASSSGTVWVPTLYDNQSVIRFQAIGDNSPIPDSLTVSELTSGEADFYVTLQYEAASS